MTTTRVFLVSLTILMAASLGCSISAFAADTDKAATLTIKGVTYCVVPDEEMRDLGFAFADVAPEENAATYYLQVFDVYWPQSAKDEPELLELRDDVLKNGWTDEAGPLVEYLKRNEKALELIKQAAATSACHFPFLLGEGQTIDEAGPYCIRVLQPANMRELAKYLRTLGAWHESEGRHADALDAYLLCFRLGSHVAQDPSLINGLVGFACDVIGMRGIERCVIRNELDEQTLANAQERLHALFETRPDLRVAMAGERAMSIEGVEWLLRDPENLTLLGYGGSDVLTRIGRHAIMKSEKWRAQMRQDVADFWDEMDEILKMPLNEFIESGVKEEFVASLKVRRRPPNPMAVLGSGLPRARIQYVRHDLEWAVADMVFALARYRAKQGEYPAKLDEVKGLMLMDGMDPYSGKPLKYRLEDDGAYTIWSVGENLTDDGGVVGSKSPDWEAKDFVWNSAVIHGED